MKEYRLITVLIAVATFVLGIVCYFLLPENVVIQVGFAGEASRTLPKLLAILLSYLLTAFLLFSAYAREKVSMIWVSLAGILVLLLTLIMNL